jgi:anti-anti-sigma factor
MECSINESNGRTVIVVRGNLDNEQSARIFRDTMYNLLTAGKKEAIIDMSKVESINSHGIGKLLLFYKKFKDVGGNLKISAPQGSVKEVFETLMLDRLFKIE